MRNFIHYFIKHSVIANWIMLVICLAGVFALSTLNKRVNPKMEFEVINVDVPFPGASAVEVEEGIVTKIEENIRGQEGIDRVTSTSSDGFGSLRIEIDPDYDMNKALQNIKNSVNSINSYPTDAEKPVVYQASQWNRAIMYSIYGPENLLTLKNIVEEFRDELLSTGRISNVRMWGIPEREISIEISPDNLIRYGLTINDISVAVRNSNLNISSGSVLTDQEQILIRSYNKKYEAKELENIEVVSGIDGKKIELRDICTIAEQWPENRFYSEYDNKKSVGFNVMYSNSEDVVEIVDITERLVEKYEEKYNGIVKFVPFIKETDDLKERIDLMTENGLLGFALVVIILSVFLNSRLAFWVSVGIPISLLGMFFMLWILGITINEMSLFGIIMVIGILVDDGIIIGESIYSQFEKYGKKPVQAAIDGVMDVYKPVTISVVTTIIAFVPYFYFYGGLGKSVWQIAAVVITALLFSLVEALMILPAHIAHSKALVTETKSTNLFARFRNSTNKLIDILINTIYSKTLKFSLKHRWAVTAGVISIILIIVGMFQGNHVRAQFFPELEAPYARVEVTVPAGISAVVANKIRNDIINTSLEFAKTWEDSAKGVLNPIKNFTSWMNGNTINIFFVLPNSELREYNIAEFSNALSDYIGEVPEAESVMVGGFNFGGNPITVKFISHDYTQLMKAKDLLKEELKNIAGVKDIQDDTPLGNNEFIVELKPKGKALGFTLRDLTTQLRQGFYGQEIMRLQRGRDEVKIWTRFNKENRISISQIENLKVRTPSGSYVPFKEVAEYSIQRSLRRIRHEDGERSIRVFTNFDYAQNDLAVVMQELNSEIVPRVLTQVEGVRQSFGGQAEEMGKIMQSMQYSMSLAMIVMFTILMFLLKSYFQTLLVMSLIPLGIIGAVLGHWIMGIPVSILSFLGIVALAGIIVNDSVVFVDRFNKLLRKYDDIGEALYHAAKSRFRPIVLTTVTTCGGLAPMILLKSDQGQWLVPMALSVAAGLIFGTVLTLFVLPSALYTISDLRALFNKNKSRIELEPGFKSEEEDFLTEVN